MITDNKKSKLAFQIFSLVCLLAIVVCFICDLAIHKGLTWVGYPLSSILYGWLIIATALLAKHHKILCTLLAVTAATIPFLFMMEAMTLVKGWFYALGMPIAITVLVAMWISYIIVRYGKWNGWYKLAAITFVYGILVSLTVSGFVSAYTQTNLFGLNTVINGCSGLVVTALLAMVGYHKSKLVKLKQELEAR